MNNEASRIIEALSADLIARELGITPRAIRHAKSVGQFSGLWFDALSKLCAAHNVPCPSNAFFWKSPAKKHGNGVNEVQGSRGQSVA